MCRVFFILFLVSITSAAPTSEDAQARIIEYENRNDGTGNYEFSYKTSNGLTRHETGFLVNAGQPNAHIEVEGEYSYMDSDGKVQTVRYTADENGYRINEEPPIVSVSLPGAAVASLLG